MTEAENKTVVTRFLMKCSDGAAAFEDGITSCFTAATIWENVGFTTTAGIEQALELLGALQRPSDFGRFSFEVLDIACVDDHVLTERMDRLFGVDGSERTALRSMGIFAVADGKISAWRNYPAQPLGHSIFQIQP